MNKTQPFGRAVLIAAGITAGLTLLSALSFFLILSKAFDIGYMGDFIIKPLSFFISLSFLQALCVAVPFRNSRRVLMWIGIVCAFVSLVILVVSSLLSKGSPFEAVKWYAVFGTVSVIILLLINLCMSIPAIAEAVGRFFRDHFGPDRVSKKSAKEIDARNLHNAAEDEVSPVSKNSVS